MVGGMLFAPLYLNRTEQTNKYIQVNATRYPIWAALAHDFLSIMALSVSSEHIFSQGGITISKRHSCLKGEIVEALQCYKCAIQHDLLFWEPAPSSILENEMDEHDDDVNDGDDKADSEQGLDELLIEEDDDDVYNTAMSDVE